MEEARVGLAKPDQKEKCRTCKKPPAGKGVEYCTPCGRAYVDTLRPGAAPRREKRKRARSDNGNMPVSHAGDAGSIPAESTTEET